MASSPVDSTGEYEFNDSQNQLIGSLARKMALVGMVMLFFGLLQMINGVTSLFMSRNPDRIVAAAEGRHAGGATRYVEAGDFGRLLVVADHGFLARVRPGRLASICRRDVDATSGGGLCWHRANQRARYLPVDGRTRCVDRKYGLIYSILLFAAITSLLSLAIGLWHSWRGGA